MRRSRSCLRISCAVVPISGVAERLQQPGPGRVGIGHDIARRCDGVGAEQLSCAHEQGAHFVELLLQRRISHGLTLPRPSQLHNSLTG